MWPFRDQAARAEEIRAELVDLLAHITDEVAAADAVDALGRLKRMSSVLRYDAEREVS